MVKSVGSGGMHRQMDNRRIQRPGKPSRLERYSVCNFICLHVENPASAAAHSSQLYSSVWKERHIESSKTSHIFSKSGYTFLVVSHGLTLQEFLILVSGFQKLFFKLTKEGEEEKKESFHISGRDKLLKHHKRKKIYIMVLLISDMALRENIPRTEVLAIFPGLSHLKNAAKGNPSRRTGNKN